MNRNVLKLMGLTERVCKVVSAVVIMVAVGCSVLNAEEQTGMPQVRTIEAVRADTPPVLDGKLDEVCWQKAQEITDFFSIDSDRRATYQSIGYICYDDAHLYIGMKCLMPEGVAPGFEKGSEKKKPHDTYVFGDDIVEIMIDPGHSQTDYYQLVVSAYGSTFDTYRRSGGTQHDPSWNGDWSSGAYIGEGFWSMEMAVPFHNLGISKNVGSTWGINLCREAKMPRDELSSMAVNGAFNNTKSFAVLKGLNVDFSKYFFQIGPAVTRLESGNERLSALFTVPIKNMTGKTMKTKIDRWYAGVDGKDAVESQAVTLGSGGTIAFSAESLAVEPLSPGRSDAYIIKSVPDTKKIVVSDAVDGTILAVSLVNRPWFCEAMKIDVEDPWQKDMTSEKSQSVSLKVWTLLTENQLKSGELSVTLTSRETGKTLANKKFTSPSEITKTSFSTKDLPCGAYDVKATFKDSNGREIVASGAVATVLPGGKQYIKVLNNMVSELMDAKERGLLGEERIEFMNPRDGWVFFSISGAGHAMLDTANKPIVEVKAGEEPVESMQYLPVGRHTLHIDGKMGQVIVRAVPELVFSCHPSGFSWDFLKKEVLPNCNTILGGTNDVSAMKEWMADGKKWVTFAAAPGHGGGGYVSYSAEKYYEILAAHEGFKNPLLSGMMVDQFGGSSIEQKVAYAGALSRIVANPEFKGKAFQPWYEGAVFGSEGDIACMKVVLEAGWPFSFYLYATEQPTQEQARRWIQDKIVQTGMSCNEQIPGSLRRAIVTLGYWTDVTTGQIVDINPAVNFKVLMQMQQETLANDPAFFGAYGILWYYSPYVDEETLRWSSRLYRHYGIDGKTTPLTTDPYLLTYIKNPEFEQGTESWTITEAEPGAVSVQNFAGYGFLEGRYLGGSIGDTFLVTKRSSKAPNAFSQEIKNLKAGRTYSMKMITADYQNITGGKSVNQQDGISIKLDNVEMVTGAGKNGQKTYPNHYGHPLGKFTATYNAYMNYHWYIFRAKGSSAKLTVSDWGTSNEPGGQIGQEIMYNFVEIEPYFGE